MADLEYKKSPKHNLETWGYMINFLKYSAAAVAVTLLLMAAFLT